MAVIGLLAPSIVLLILASLAIILPQGLFSLNNGGPHGLTEILYAFASACGTCEWAGIWLTPSVTDASAITSPSTRSRPPASKRWYATFFEASTAAS